MEIRGCVQDGVEVLEDGPALPAGKEVTVACAGVRLLAKPVERKRITEILNEVPPSGGF